MAKAKVTFRRRYLDRGGYDSSGKYYGVGEPLYDIIDKDGDSIGQVRAKYGETKKAMSTRVCANLDSVLRGY